MNLGTIKERARKALNEPSSGGHWSDALYYEAINDGQIDFAIRTECLRTSLELTTDGSNSQYDISESAIEAMSEPALIRITQLRYYHTSDHYYILRHISQNELSAMAREMDGVVATPSYFNYQDRVIEFDTVPPAGKTVLVRYSHLPEELLLAADVSDVPEKFHGALVMYTCWKFAESADLEIDRTSYFKNEYELAIGKAMKILYPAALTGYGGINDDTKFPHYI